MVLKLKKSLRKSQSTNICHVFRFGNISLVRMLIDEGASRGLEDAQGMSPLAHAREKDCITIIGMLEKADKRGRECSNRINC